MTLFFVKIDPVYDPEKDGSKMNVRSGREPVLHCRNTGCPNTGENIYFKIQEKTYSSTR